MKKFILTTTAAIALSTSFASAATIHTTRGSEAQTFDTATCVVDPAYGIHIRRTSPGSSTVQLQQATSCSESSIVRGLQLAGYTIAPDPATFVPTGNEVATAEAAQSVLRGNNIIAATVTVIARDSYRVTTNTNGLTANAVSNAADLDMVVNGIATENFNFDNTAVGHTQATSGIGYDPYTNEYRVRNEDNTADTRWATIEGATEERDRVNGIVQARYGWGEAGPEQVVAGSLVRGQIVLAPATQEFTTRTADTQEYTRIETRTLRNGQTMQRNADGYPVRREVAGTAQARIANPAYTAPEVRQAPAAASTETLVNDFRSSGLSQDRDGFAEWGEDFDDRAVTNARTAIEAERNIVALPHEDGVITVTSGETSREYAFRRQYHDVVNGFGEVVESRVQTNADDEAHIVSRHQPTVDRIESFRVIAAQSQADRDAARINNDRTATITLTATAGMTTLTEEFVQDFRTVVDGDGDVVEAEVQTDAAEQVTAQSDLQGRADTAEATRLQGIADAAPDTVGDWSAWTKVEGSISDNAAAKGKFLTSTWTESRIAVINVNGNPDAPEALAEQLGVSLSDVTTVNDMEARTITVTQTRTRSASTINPAWVAANAALKEDIKSGLMGSLVLETTESITQNQYIDDARVYIRPELGEVGVKVTASETFETPTHELTVTAQPRASVIGIGKDYSGYTHGLNVEASAKGKKSDTEYALGYDTGTHFRVSGKKNGFSGLKSHGRTDSSFYAGVTRETSNGIEVEAKLDTDGVVGVELNRDGYTLGANSEGQIKAGYTITF